MTHTYRRSLPTDEPRPAAHMPTHRCLDPQDPFAEREVRVAFEWIADHPRLLAALDDEEADILPDLIEAQCDDLRREIAAARASEARRTCLFPGSASGTMGLLTGTGTRRQERPGLSLSVVSRRPELQEALGTAGSTDLSSRLD
jgi:hypothetical protein